MIRRGRDGGARETTGGERQAAPGERDIDDGVGFPRGTARPDTALMVAYIDEFKDRFRGEPIRRVLARGILLVSLGFLHGRARVQEDAHPAGRPGLGCLCSIRN